MNDPVHFACLYLHEQPALRRLLSRMTGSLSMADDLVQDVFVRLMETEVRASQIRNPRAYLHQSARNIAINALRRQQRYVSDDAAAEMPDPAPPVVERLIAREELLRVMRAIAALPARRREVFVLSRVDNRTYDEIAAQLGISRNTVMVQIVRALSDLRRALDM
ncbi:RNA polymerase sigma factor [Frigidibacter sp.]|uniref:RNA polymerase sigma factor n=1 Tax=Frigidibacter sp. TaxID=2586418 RepID=UPI0027338F74|nr:sigma-70 family RNA polymerase sigma factor [Frigidibacter sp.]MDP3339324.1 sigma-70 family RNA polymerase sigma factor [Frigidibacter sp.]